MPKPEPLSGPAAARRTLAHRLSPVADRLRQLNTRMGLRSLRVFLVWSKWGGATRGEGTETVTNRVELLPTPKVTDMASLSRRPYLAGVFSEGTVRVDEISSNAYTLDVLKGLVIPTVNGQGIPVNGQGVERTTDPTTDFFYEIVEDGRGDSTPERMRFRLFGGPSRSMVYPSG